MAMDDRRKGTTTATKVNTGMGRLGTWSMTVDCAADPVTSGDVVELLYIPAGTWILGAGAYVETAEGGTLTVDLGLYAAANDAETDLDGFLNDLNGNATGAKVSASEAYVATMGYRATAAQNLCATFNNAADAAKITFYAVLADFRP